MNVPVNANLNKNLGEQLPADLLDFIRKAGELAHRRQQRLYLVGGTVRDLLLDRPTPDIDLVLEGDAVKLAPEIASVNGAEVTSHPRFGTATIRWRNRRADLATARIETYARPGALPMVRPGTIREDLARRDFTVNAMAVELNPIRFGELIDLYGGLRDIKKRLVRVLHYKSFSDDATRIWRAIRYEQRLDFSLEKATLDLMRRDIDRLDTVSGDRIRHELELVLKEETPEKALRRAGELGALAKIHPALKGDDWLAETFAAAAARYLPDTPHPHLYLALLCYRLDGTVTAKVIRLLHLPKATAQVLRNTAAVRAKVSELAMPGVAPSRVYEILHGYSLTSLEANALGTDSETAAEHIELYLNVLRHVNPTLSGDDLLKLGIPKGPRIKEALQRLREARLDGKIDNRREEEEIVREISFNLPS